MKKGILLLLLITSYMTQVLYAQITMPQLQSLQYANYNFGNALNFNGFDTYAIGQAYPKDSMINFTLEFWIKNTGTDNAHDRIYGSYNNNALQIGKSNNSLKLLLTDLGGANTWQTACTLESNIWIHLAFVRSLSTLTVFKNASSVATYTIAPSISLPNLFRLGSNISGTDENGNFTMDEMRIWNVPRTKNQIQQYMYSTIDPNVNTSLILYYRFDQGIAGENNPNELGLYNSAINN